MSVADNKRIAKNTIFLYIRMFVSILISFYTSRKILEALGVEDFGILNVVGGVISMLAFLNGSMSVATQRFLTVELGKKDYGGYNRVFNMSVLIHVGLAILILIAAETIGLWFVNVHLNIRFRTDVCSKLDLPSHSAICRYRYIADTLQCFYCVA